MKYKTSQINKMVISIPIYKKYFYLVTDREVMNSLLETYNKVAVYDDDEIGGCVYTLNSGTYAIYLVDKTLPILMHEITHLALFCLDNGDDYDLRENGENLCYLIEYLTEVCLKKLKINEEIKV